MKTQFSRRDLYAMGEPFGESATYERAGRRVYGGGGGGFLGDIVGGIGDIVGGAVDAVGDLGQGLIDTVSDAGSSLDDFVREEIPGGWALPVAAATAGALGGESLLSGIGAGGAGAAEAGLAGLAEGAFPGAVAGTVASDAGLAALLPAAGVTTAPVLSGAVAESALPALETFAPETLIGQGSYAAPAVAAGPGEAGWGMNLGTDAVVSGPGESGWGMDLGTDAASTDSGLLADANQSQAEVNRLLAQEASAAGVPIGSAAGTTGLAGLMNSMFGSNLTNSGALTALLGGGLGVAGIKSLLDADAKKYGVPGVKQYTGPMNRFNYNPAAYQPTRVDPNMFRPRGMAMGGATTMVPDPDAVPPGFADSVIRMAAGGAAKPKYTNKATLAAMQPWERAQAELNNAAAMGRMPTGAQDIQTRMSRLGQYAAGGGISSLGGYSDGGRMLKGPGDGMSDNIPATIAGKQPARLANEEFVVPADVVSHLGNGSSEAGAKQLYKMMDRVRHARTGSKKQGKQINPNKFMPA